MELSKINSPNGILQVKMELQDELVKLVHKNCPRYPRYCNASHHRDETCHTIMKRYYGKNAGSETYFMCPKCKTVELYPYRLWYEKHKCHLSVYSSHNNKRQIMRHCTHVTKRLDNFKSSPGAVSAIVCMENVARSTCNQGIMTDPVIYDNLVDVIKVLSLRLFFEIFRRDEPEIVEYKFFTISQIEMSDEERKIQLNKSPQSRQEGNRPSPMQVYPANVVTKNDTNSICHKEVMTDQVIYDELEDLIKVLTPRLFVEIFEGIQPDMPDLSSPLSVLSEVTSLPSEDMSERGQSVASKRHSVTVLRVTAPQRQRLSTLSDSSSVTPTLHSQ